MTCSQQDGKHTPGPWNADEDSVFIFGPQMEMIAELRGEGAQLPIEANARLIEAAPEMGKMLREELEDLDCWLRDESVSDDTKEAMLTREYKIQRLLQKAGLR